DDRRVVVAANVLELVGRLVDVDHAGRLRRGEQALDVLVDLGALTVSRSAAQHAQWHVGLSVPDRSGRSVLTRQTSLDPWARCDSSSPTPPCASGTRPFSPPARTASCSTAPRSTPVVAGSRRTRACCCGAVSRPAS